MRRKPIYLLLLLAKVVFCRVDLYLDPEQTEALFGIDADGGGGGRGVFYVKDGVVNHYALGFHEQIVPASLSYLLFHWRATPQQEQREHDANQTATSPPPEEIPNRQPTGRRPVAYSLHLIHTSGPAMDPPAANVSAVGVVPESDQAFAVRFPCTGEAADTVDFLIQIKFAFGKTWTESLNFKGKKVCLAAPRDNSNKNNSSVNNFRSTGGGTRRKNKSNLSIRIVGNHQTTTSRRQRPTSSSVPTFFTETTTTKTGLFPTQTAEDEDDGGLGRPFGNFRDPNSTTVLALGTAAGAVALMFVLLTVLYATGKKRAPRLMSNSAASFGLGSHHHHHNHHDSHYSADFIRQKAVAASSAGNGRAKGGYNYRFNGGMGLAGTGSTLTRNCEAAAARKAAEGQVRGAGSYATLASFANVPLAAPVGREADYGNGNAVGDVGPWQQRFQGQYQQQQQQQQQPNPASNSRWLRHYGSNQSSIWSSSQTMTSTMRNTMSNKQQERSSSQSTIFGRRPPPTTTDPATATSVDNTLISSVGSSSLPKSRQPRRPFPQQNSLVLENGVLKLCPQQQMEDLDHDVDAEMEMRPRAASTDSRLDGEESSAANRRRPTDTLKSNKTEEEILEMQRQLLEGSAPFYQSPEGFLAFDPRREAAEDNGNPAPPFSLYTPQIYPHLMPQNIKQKQVGGRGRRQKQQQQHFTMDDQQQQQRLPRSTSGGSVLV